MIGSKEGLLPVEKSIIDFCVREVYKPWLSNPIRDNIPTMQDLWEKIKEEPGQDAAHIAKAMELYVTGSMNLFNCHSNVDVNNRFICYDIKDLVSSLKQLGMLIVQDAVWGRVSENRSKSKKTWYYMDEFHTLLKDEETARYVVEFYKRFRKWGGKETYCILHEVCLIAVLVEASKYTKIMSAKENWKGFAA